MELKGTTGTYQMEFGVNEMCRIEEEFGDESKSCLQILQELMRPSMRMTDIRRLVQCLLTDPATPTVEETGRIIDDVGGPATFILALQGASNLQALQVVAPDTPQAETSVDVAAVN